MSLVHVVVSKYRGASSSRKHTHRILNYAIDQVYSLQSLNDSDRSSSRLLGSRRGFVARRKPYCQSVYNDDGRSRWQILMVNGSGGSP